MDGARQGRRSGHGGRSLLTWFTHASAAAALLLLALLGAPTADQHEFGPLTFAVLPPLGAAFLATRYWTICGAWNTATPGRCQRRRKGLFARCHSHRSRGTLFDALALHWAVTCGALIVTVTLPLAPAALAGLLGR